MTRYRFIEVEPAAPQVQRIRLNRPEKRNAIHNALRGELLEALREADGDPDVHVSIVCGAGSCFSSGYDLKSDLGSDQPYFTAQVGMQWARHVSEGWMSIWDLAKPVIAQIHGYAMAGGLELAGACDLAYAARDARLSHPVLRFAGLPDFAWFPAFLAPRHAMELHLAGRVYSGEEAERVGLINRAFESEELEESVLEIARTIAETPPAVVSANKRYVHACVEARGGRSMIRTAGDLQAGRALQSMVVDPLELTAKVKAIQQRE
ncbi:MAG: enoyl-CoA hydratase/isomerase family protein [Proteobacteria bacterium]|nr:enoyl-CoA hydratase/isomerase family protein [Pseudomonadota bacterium]